MLSNTGLPRLLRLASAALGLLALAAPAAHAAFPEKPITIVVGLPPGSPNDVLARLVGDRLAKRIGQPVIVMNRPGAAGMVATQAFVTRTAADGYTLLVGSVTLGTAQALKKTPEFDVADDMTPLVQISRSPMAVAIPASLPPKTLDDFVKFVRPQPDVLNFASVGGVGGAVHLYSLLFQKAAGIKLTHIPYPGSAAAVPALMDGQVHLFVVDNSSVIAGIQAGKVRALAVAARERLAHLPDVPTTVEAGIPFEAAAWYGLFAPKNLPADIRAFLQEHLLAIVRDESFRAELASRGSVPGTVHGEDLRALIRNEVSRWQAIVRDEKIEQE